jgi:hypothetical protein
MLVAIEDTSLMATLEHLKMHNTASLIVQLNTMKMVRLTKNQKKNSKKVKRKILTVTLLTKTLFLRVALFFKAKTQISLSVSRTYLKLPFQEPITTLKIW